MKIYDYVVEWNGYYYNVYNIEMSYLGQLFVACSAGGYDRVESKKSKSTLRRYFKKESEHIKNFGTHFIKFA